VTNPSSSSPLNDSWTLSPSLQGKSRFFFPWAKSSPSSAHGLLRPILYAFFIAGMLVALYQVVVFLFQWFPIPNSRSVLYMLSSGFLFSLLAGMLAWPFALTSALVLANEQDQSWAKFLVYYFRSLSFIPTIIYGYIFCSFFGPFLQDHFYNIWMHLFDTSGWLAQVTAFVITILLYPLMYLSLSRITVDYLYLATLNSLSEFAVESFSSVVVILFLTFLLTPIFITLIYQSLVGSKLKETQLTMLSLGASSWDTLRISGRQHLRNHLWSLFSFGISRAFFEGVGVFIVLNYFFLNSNFERFFWTETFSAFVVKIMIFKNIPMVGIFSLCFILMLSHSLFFFFYRKLAISPRDELLR